VLPEVDDCTTASVAVKRCANKFMATFFWHENAAQNLREKSPQSPAPRGKKFFLCTLFCAWKNCLVLHHYVARWRIDEKTPIFFEKSASDPRIKRCGDDFLGKKGRVESLLDHTQENAATSADLESGSQVNIHCRLVRCVNGQNELLSRRMRDRLAR